jgi:predicted metal-dependent hydrolase
MTKPAFEPAFMNGVTHFNALEFWEAHEAWEELWLVAETDVEQFLQGLIQVAAAYHHLKRGTFRGGVRLFDSGLARLSRFPAGFCGIDRTDVESASRVHQAWARERLENADGDARLASGAYPKISVVGKTSPQISDW